MWTIRRSFSLWEQTTRVDSRGFGGSAATNRTFWEREQEVWPSLCEEELGRSTTAPPGGAEGERCFPFSSLVCLLHQMLFNTFPSSSFFNELLFTLVNTKLFPAGESGSLFCSAPLLPSQGRREKEGSYSRLCSLSAIKRWISFINTGRRCTLIIIKLVTIWRCFTYKRNNYMSLFMTKINLHSNLGRK